MSRFKWIILVLFTLKRSVAKGERYRAPRDRVVWNDAISKCNKEYSNAGLYQLSKGWRTRAQLVMEEHKLDTLWVDLQSQVKLQWINGTFADKVLRRDRIRGECVMFDDNSLLGVSCEHPRELLCLNSENKVGPFCGPKPMTWKDAKDFCLSKNSELWPGFIPPQNNNLDCTRSSKGIWLGVRVVRLPNALSRKTGYLPSLKNDCTVNGRDDWSRRCGVLMKEYNSSVACRLMSCEDKHPYICEVQPPPKTKESKNESSSQFPTVTMQNEMNFSNALEETTNEEPLTNSMAGWKITVATLCPVFICSAVCGIGFIFLQKRRKKRPVITAPITITDIQKEQNAALESFEGAAKRIRPDSSVYEAMYDKIPYTDMENKGNFPSYREDITTDTRMVSSEKKQPANGKISESANNEYENTDSSVFYDDAEVDSTEKNNEYLMPIDMQHSLKKLRSLQHPIPPPPISDDRINSDKGVYDQVAHQEVESVNIPNDQYEPADMQPCVNRVHKDADEEELLPDDKKESAMAEDGKQVVDK